MTDPVILKLGKSKLLAKEATKLRDLFQERDTQARGFICAADIDRFIEAFDGIDRNGLNSVRIYSSSGFVSNGYRGFPQIAFLHATVDGDQITVTKGLDSAKRAYGHSTMDVANGRVSLEVWESRRDNRSAKFEKAA